MWVGKHKYIFITMTAMSLTYFAGIITVQAPWIGLPMAFIGGLMLGNVAARVPTS